MTLTEIENRMTTLERALACPSPHPTEVYTRIVGYYRSLANWNAGKREEYNHRSTFVEDGPRIHAALVRAEGALPKRASPGVQTARAQRFVVFLKKNCPHCPAMKARLPELTFPGDVFDTDTPEGYEAAVKFEIYATPTLILLDDAGTELVRISNALDWSRITGYL